MTLTEDKFSSFKKDYIIYGTAKTYDEYKTEQLVRDEAKGTIYVMWQPLKDQTAVYDYGTSVKDMVQAAYYGSLELSEHDQFDYLGHVYEITTIKHWPSHKELHAKRIDQAVK